MKMRVGSGWDLHRLTEGRALILGGVSIPSAKGCLGHSDGDALIHAVIDSLLGACGMDDIGDLFPDTDSRFKDINSMILLDEVLKQVRALGASIINVDTTIVLQSPKLGPYKKQIKSTMAKALGIDASCFCVKAKTAEHILGELGSSDAVMCQSTCLVAFDK